MRTNYSATKIYLTCDEQTVREWANFMNQHREQVEQSLTHEQVRHEMWLMGNNEDGLYVIGVMDVADKPASARIATTSLLEINRVHHAFKSHWDRARITALAINPAQTPNFFDCEMLIDARGDVPIVAE